mgnify:CR=1 FL=1
MNIHEFKTKKAIAALRVKLKSLATESKIIRQEIEKSNNPHIKNSLYRHKIDIVRQEARHTHLVYACIKNVPYHKIEPKTHNKPNWDKVEKMVKRFYNLDYHGMYQQFNTFACVSEHPYIKEWLDNAKC